MCAFKVLGSWTDETNNSGLLGVTAAYIPRVVKMVPKIAQHASALLPLSINQNQSLVLS